MTGRRALLSYGPLRWLALLLACHGPAESQADEEDADTDADADTDGDSDADTAYLVGQFHAIRRGIYEVDLDVPTLAGATTQELRIVDNGAGRFEVGEIICTVSWPVRHADDPVPTLPCEDCDFAIRIVHADGAVDSNWKDLCGEPEWITPGSNLEHFAGIGYSAALRQAFYYNPSPPTWRYMGYTEATFDGRYLSVETDGGFSYYYY